MTDWLVTHGWITLGIIYVCLIYVYNKVFRVRKLPILKELIVYLVMLVGAYILFLFQVDLRLPIVYCLGMAVLLMFMVRIRYFVEDLQKKKQQRQ